ASKKIILTLLNKKLVACVNKIENVESFYWWEQKISIDKEVLLVMKTRKDKIDKIITEIKKIHPYQVPEIITIPIIKGNKEYLNWIKNTIL
ncbi:MAG: divalent-cation tolerance protein CutA, partial [Endomicrobia bacterium]|nr:divalent-cation tolerance protein CutA [Endomicrobiia bacterium]